MDTQGFVIEELPELDNPTFIAGFDGWGNALNVAKTMAGYLTRKLSAKSIGKINPDLFYRYDETRPVVRIEEGLLKSVLPPGGKLYASQNSPGGGDLIILRAHEPNLHWARFVDDLYGLCGTLGVSRIVTLGSMYDNVLHTDRIVSGIASSPELLDMIKQEGILPINYFGPSGIHSTIHAEGLKRGFECISLWCHCPYYLQGTTHFGLVSQLGAILSRLIGFELDTEELEDGWRELNKQI
ncbi:MAG: PAC2 family protein, partial [Deltaproteobacteria bacterium]|nr:PAC2 family protein [Deltaproteobacteria bacterium]